LFPLFAAGVVPVGEFATGINNTSETGGKICEYFREFSKKFEMVLMGYSGAGGKLIHEKTRSKKSRDTVPLKGQ
jgi:hypothetical protein